MTAQLSRERILEMEEEMSRFEQEIAQPQVPPDFRGFAGGKMRMQPELASSSMQFIPHQVHHQVVMGPPPGEHQPVFARQHFPPQNMMGPMQMPMPPAPPFALQASISHGAVPTQGLIPQPMVPQPMPGPPVPVLIANPPRLPEPTIVAPAPTVYAAPPVKLVTVFKEPKFEARQLPPPPPLPPLLKTEVQLEVPPPAILHKGVVGRPPEHTYQEPTAATSKKSSNRKKKIVRLAGNQIWEDNSLLDWDLDDFRLFCGDLGNDVTDEILTRTFSRYPSFLKAKVVRDKRTNKTKGFGFVSFKDPQDFIKAMKDMNGKYVGSRPIKLRKSSWRDRNIEIVKKKQKEKEKLGLL